MGGRLFGRRRSVARMAQEISLSPERSERPLPDKPVPPVIDPEASLAWFVIVTAPRSEGRAEKALRHLHFTPYVPLKTYWERRKVHSRLIKIERQKPLIPGYLFLGFGPDNNWYNLRKVDSVVGVLSNNGAPGQISAHEIKRLADLERDGWFDERRRPRFEDTSSHPPYRTGDQVLITGGSPLSGLSGLFRSGSTRQRVKILITMFGRLTPMVLPIDKIVSNDVSARS